MKRYSSHACGLENVCTCACLLIQSQCGMLLLWHAMAMEQL